MQVICGLYGHRPSPSARLRGRGQPDCVLCGRKLARGSDGCWELAAEPAAVPAAPSKA